MQNVPVVPLQNPVEPQNADDFLLPPLNSLTLLLVDDSRSMLIMLKSQLEKSGFVLFKTAVSGLEALDILENDKVEVILSDWNMPGMGGLELLAKVRASARCARLPFILVTAKAASAHILLAIRAGADDYVIKPVNVENLAKKIQSVLRRKLSLKKDL
ncbi:MAG: response regulator [Fibrobacterota bacterium]